ncbi:MAG TPA: site-specific integrase [Bryobacteraceae bacterium]|nr:site-specific integrase [Bryobacteraceae bacterium]
MKRRTYGKGSLTQNGRKQWRLQYYVRGVCRQENSGTEDRKQAEELLARRIAEAQLETLDGVTPEEVTVDQLCRLVIADQKLRGLRDWKTVEWRYLANTKPVLGKLVARRAKTADFREYITNRLAEGAAKATVNRELATVRRGFKLGMREEPPLVRRIPYIPELDESDNVRQGFLDPDQYELLLRELPLSLEAIFVCAYNIGTRLNEIRRLEWTEVDFAAKTIRLPGDRTKNKAPRTLPFTGDMEAYLLRQRERCPESNPYVFFGQHGHPVSDKLYGWREACERAGWSELIFHDLRRTAVRDMKRAGVSDSLAMKISGHKTRNMLERYDIADEADLADAAEKVNRYRARKRVELGRKRLKVAPGGGK